MDKHITIELQSRLAEAGDDTAGYIRAGDGGCVPSKGGRLFQIAPNLAIRLTLPDPAPVARGADVQGFIAVEQRPDTAPEPKLQDGTEVQGYLWWIYALAAGGGLAAGYGIGSAYGDFIGYDEEYHKNPKYP